MKKKMMKLEEEVKEFRDIFIIYLKLQQVTSDLKQYFNLK